MCDFIVFHPAIIQAQQREANMALAQTFQLTLQSIIATIEYSARIIPHITAIASRNRCQFIVASFLWRGEYTTILKTISFLPPLLSSAAVS